MTIKFWKCKFYCRAILLSLRRLLKERGVENLTNDTPPKKGFWTPARTVRFPARSGGREIFLSLRRLLKERGVENLTNDAPPKKGFWTPARTVRFPARSGVVALFFSSCTKIHDRADQKLFWRGPNFWGRACSLVRFPPPIRFAAPDITAQITLFVRIANLGGFVRNFG